MDKMDGEIPKTFEYDGQTFEYPFWCYRTGSLEEDRTEYRTSIIRSHIRKKEESKLRTLPFKEKIRRHSKNVGLELLATSIEALFAILRL